MSQSKILISGTGDDTSEEFIIQRRQDDNGMWQIDWTPNSPPGTVTFLLQVKLHEDLTGWATVKTVTESDLGSSAGLKTFAEQVPLAYKMRVKVENNDDAANAYVVALQE